MRAEVLLALLLAWPAHAGAEDLPWIPRVPGSAFDYTLPDDYLPGRVVLKFAEGTGVRLVEGRFQLREERLDARLLPPALALDDLPARLRVIETEMLDHPAAGEPTSLFNADEN
ncbi:MAG: hypothetical protein KDD47_27505, partial [Acidobacteria bacterium]|nr:hypothetical protein [Acidobacteriota bacterium]